MFDGFYKQPLGYSALEQAAWELKKTYPFLTVSSIGTSILGRELFSFSIGSPKKGTLLVGAVHGMEWLTALLLIRFLEDICRSLHCGSALAEIDLARSLRTCSLTVIPCLNPDGVEISVAGTASVTEEKYRALVENASGGDASRWQANARGVDLNHNFDAGFSIARAMERNAGILEPGPTRHGGPYPHSEPETAALVRFCENTQPAKALAFHSQGEEIYYRYGRYTPPRSRLMAQVLAGASGYRLAEPEALASHGGFKDWFLRRFGAPAFTIEIGRGKNPLPVEELEPIYARLLEMLLISVML